MTITKIIMLFKGGCFLKLFNIELGMFNYQEYIIVLQFNDAQAISPILEILFWRLSKIYSCYCDGRMSLIYNEDKTLNQLQYISANFMDLKKVYTIIFNYVVKYSELKTTLKSDDREYFENKNNFKNENYQEFFDESLLNNVYLLNDDCVIFKHPNVSILEDDEKIYALEIKTNKLYTSLKKTNMKINDLANIKDTTPEKIFNDLNLSIEDEINNFRKDVAQICVDIIKKLCSIGEYESAAMYYYELLDLFCVAPDTVSTDIEELKQLKSIFISQLSEYIICNITSRVKLSENLKEYILYVTYVKNNKSDRVLYTTIQKYKEYIKRLKYVQISFYDFLRERGFSDGTKIRTYLEFRDSYK